MAKEIKNVEVKEDLLVQRIEKLEEVVKRILDHCNGQIRCAKVGADPFNISTPEIEGL